MTVDLTDERYADMITVDGFDDAIIGIASRYGNPDVLAYDVHQILQILMNRDGMDWDDANEWLDFNIAQAYMGNTTPVFIERLEKL